VGQDGADKKLYSCLNEEKGSMRGKMPRRKAHGDTEKILKKKSLESTVGWKSKKKKAEPKTARRKHEDQRRKKGSSSFSTRNY